MAPSSATQPNTAASSIDQTYEVDGETIVVSDGLVTTQQPNNDDPELTAWFLSRVKVFRPSLKIEEEFKDADPRRLLKLRDVTSRRRSVPRTLDMARIQNVDAGMVYIYGDEVVQDKCEKCARYSGPFPKCVWSEGLLNGACASCHFGGEGSKCSFRTEEHVDNANTEAEESDSTYTTPRKKAKSSVSATQRHRTVPVNPRNFLQGTEWPMESSEVRDMARILNDWADQLELEEELTGAATARSPLGKRKRR